MHFASTVSAAAAVVLALAASAAITEPVSRLEVRERGKCCEAQRPMHGRAMGVSTTDRELHHPTLRSRPGGLESRDIQAAAVAVATSGTLRPEARADMPDSRTHQTFPLLARMFSGRGQFPGGHSGPPATTAGGRSSRKRRKQKSTRASTSNPAPAAVPISNLASGSSTPGGAGGSPGIATGGSGGISAVDSPPGIGAAAAGGSFRFTPPRTPPGAALPFAGQEFPREPPTTDRTRTPTPADIHKAWVAGQFATRTTRHFPSPSPSRSPVRTQTAARTQGASSSQTGGAGGGGGGGGGAAASRSAGHEYEDTKIKFCGFSSNDPHRCSTM